MITEHPLEVKYAAAHVVSIQVDPNRPLPSMPVTGFHRYRLIDAIRDDQAYRSSVDRDADYYCDGPADADGLSWK